MSCISRPPVAPDTLELELASFYVGDLLAGINIQHVQEISRLTEITGIPHAPTWIRGVINLRGEVVTVLDLRAILGLGRTENIEHCRNLIVNSRTEPIGLLVDRISDVVEVKPGQIEPPPANVCGVDGRFFTGVCKLDTEVLVILDVALVVDPDGDQRRAPQDVGNAD